MLDRVVVRNDPAVAEPAALARIEAAKARRAAALAEMDHLDAKIGDLLAEDLRRDLDEDEVG